jgi:hypothetical protein
VQNIKESSFGLGKTKVLTNILSVNAAAKDIEQLYGKPSRISKLELEKHRIISWQYRNGVSYHFTNGSLDGVQVSKNIWDEFQVPGWGITIEDDRGSSFSDRLTDAITGTEVKGIIRNDRETRVKVILRIRWSYKISKELADVYDSKAYEIDPHDTVIFTESGGSISKPKIQQDIVYDVKVKSVTDLLDQR